MLSFLYPSAPQEISGHTSAIKKALWCNDDKQILSAAEDKTIRPVTLHDSCSDLSFSVQKLKKNVKIICVFPGFGIEPPWKRWRHSRLTHLWAAWSMLLMERYLWSLMERPLLSTMPWGSFYYLLFIVCQLVWAKYVKRVVKKKFFEVAWVLLKKSSSRKFVLLIIIQ